MLGPFRAKDLKAQIFGAVTPGRFVLAKGEVFMAANWETVVPKPATDVLIRFDPNGLANCLAPWHPDERCLLIDAPWRLEASLVGYGVQARLGCIGIGQAGELAIAVRKDGSSHGFLLLNEGVSVDREPPGFVWSATWELDLVLDPDAHARIRLGKHPNP